MYCGHILPVVMAFTLLCNYFYDNCIFLNHFNPFLLVQSKLAESEDKVAEMAVQLEQVNADRVRLENRNSVLEKVRSAP